MKEEDNIAKDERDASSGRGEKGGKRNVTRIIP